MPNEQLEPCITSLPQPPIGYEPDEVTEGTLHHHQLHHHHLRHRLGMSPAWVSLMPPAPQHPTAIRVQPVLQPGHPPGPALPSSLRLPSRSSPAAAGGVSRARGDRSDFSPKSCPGPAVSLPPYTRLPQILHQSHQVQSQEGMKKKHKLVRTGKVSAERGLQSCLSFL